MKKIMKGINIIKMSISKKVLARPARTFPTQYPPTFHPKPQKTSTHPRKIANIKK